MRLPPAVVLAGVARTLEEDVLPAVGDRAARGLVFAALEVLANVQDLVEWRVDVREEELTAAAAALTESAERLQASGLGAEAARLRAALAAAEHLDDRAARGRALDAALEDALVVLDRARAEPGVEAALASIRAHLVNQTIRDLMRTQRPLLNRISQG
ncbi:MAG: hypothetical protein HY271_07195 [Deltaproteobacteria bacterium]|nr:hypothetical protein [Deltaproteobacteria bacterium]